jgi:signal transduction histidine kinase
MKERLKLVDGHLSIETHSPRGTTIRARVPLDRGGRSAEGARA